MWGQGSTSLKFYKRLGICKNSSGTVQFDPLTLKGRSYNWTFCAPIKGVVIFNDYQWSVTTSGHQSAVRACLRERGIKYISADFGRVGVSEDLLLKGNMQNVYRRLVYAEIAVEQSREGTRVKSQRTSVLDDYKTAFETLLNLGAKLSQRDRDTIRKEVYEEAHADLNENEFIKACKYLDVKNAETDLSETNLDNL